MTQSTMQATLLEHYKATRLRLKDPRGIVAPIIPRDRITPRELDQPREPDQAREPDQPDQMSTRVELPKEGPPKVANGITISKIPPRQSRVIIETVAEKHGMSVEEIMARSRKDRIVAARHEAFYLLREAGYSFPQIGRFFGGMDHTTALHGAVKHEAKLKKESESND